ncbi:hypothetical protein ILYODFUR_039106 [Ilyodon furcidens]|uniref:Uncharacterized protein n=1 Tax=Ilyodon furcidens TaxID=33524 RepID=A0ABV0UDC3_9TELE
MNTERSREIQTGHKINPMAVPVPRPKSCRRPEGIKEDEFIAKNRILGSCFCKSSDRTTLWMFLSNFFINLFIHEKGDKK